MEQPPKYIVLETTLAVHPGELERMLEGINEDGLSGMGLHESCLSRHENGSLIGKSTRMRVGQQDELVRINLDQNRNLAAGFEQGTETFGEARIYCPLTDNDGNDLSKIQKHLASIFGDKFGGFTQTNVRGFWRGDHGKDYEQEMLEFEVAVNVGREATVTDLMDIAKWLKIAAKQEAVYLRLPDGKVHFV